MLNKKRVILVISILIISIIFFSNTCFAVTGKVTGKTVRIREKADSEAKIITNAYRNDYVEVIEKSGDWYKVKYEGETGYMHKDYISVDDSELTDTNENTDDTSSNENENQSSDENQNTEPNENQNNNENVSVYENNKLEKIEGQEINLETDVQIKLLPNYTSKTLGSITSGTTVTVKNQLNYWVYVTNNRISGWINVRSIVEKTDNTQIPDTQDPNTTNEPDNTTNDTSNTSETKTGKINVNKANVREKPTTSSDIIAGLKENDEVTILAEEGDWYKIKTSKIKEGYVSKKLITLSTVSSRGGNLQRDEQEVQETIEETIEQEEQVQEEIIEIPVEEPVVENISSSGIGEQVAEYALQFVGCNYVYAGKNPDTGFDCSGFTQYVFANFGVSISASSKAQINYGEEVSEENILPGDLLIFYNDAKTQIGHVGIYIGNDQFVHAANSKRGVVTDSMYNSYYAPRLVAIRRLV